MPVDETPDTIPFEQNESHASCDRDYVNRFRQALTQVDRVFTQFRGQNLGNVSLVYFLRSHFDIGVTLFSGRTPPPLSGNSPNVGTWVMQEAYSHKESGCGIWPGNVGFGGTASYSYVSPAAGFALAAMLQTPCTTTSASDGRFYSTTQPDSRHRRMTS